MENPARTKKDRATECEREKLDLSSRVLFCDPSLCARRYVLALISLGVAWAQQKPDITEAWDRLLDGTPIEAPSVSGRVAAAPAARDFLKHFFLESRTEFMRQQVGFSGQPTVAVFTAQQNVFPGPFQPSAKTLYQTLRFGTREWISPRIGTDFSLRYAQDLSRVEPGSPALSILETFKGHRTTQMTEAVVSIRGLPGDGAFAGANLRMGRQYVMGAELAAFDGASFGIDRERYSLSLFGGRRFSYFSDPSQRALGGGSLSVRVGSSTNIGYDTLFYIRGSHSLSFRRRFGAGWLFNTSFRLVGSAPVDYRSQALYHSGNGKSAFSFMFAQKLTDKDYIFDYTGAARDRDPFNKFSRLYLGPLSPYTQVALDARRSLSTRLGVGGAVWIRRLNDSRDQGPFETSFEDYRLHAQAFPIRRVELDIEFHQRHSDRLSPFDEAPFGDVTHTGETRVQDFTAELRHSFAEGQLTLSGGGYYRRIRIQDRYIGAENTSQKGLLGGAWFRIDPRTRLSFDYSLDNDFYLFRPSLSHAQVFRIGLRWKY